MEKINIRFDGGIASNGQLHFYEYSRSQYATARFIATIEHFRREGVVAQRINSKAYVDMIVAAPEKGSFLEDILIPLLQEGMATFISTPMSAMLAYVWSHLTPRQQRTDDAILELAKIRLQEEQARTATEVERTAQMQTIAQIANEGHATAQQALELVRHAQTSSNPAIARSEITSEQLAEMESELAAEHNRNEEIGIHKAALENIDEATMSKLTSRLRTMVGDMTLPLKRSADVMTIAANDDKPKFAFLNLQIALEVEQRDVEEDTTRIVAHLKSYDRDAGVAKISSDDLDRVLNVILPIRGRDALAAAIISALRVDTVLLEVRRVLDGSGMPVSLILVDVVSPDEN